MIVSWKGKIIINLSKFLVKKIKIQQKRFHSQQKIFIHNYTLVSHLWRHLVGFFLLNIFYILSPIVTVRIGSVRTKTIGDMCMAMDFSHYFGSVGKKRTIDLRFFYLKYDGAISNIYLYDLIKKHNIFLPVFYLAPILYYAKRFKIYKKHIIPYYYERGLLIKPIDRWPSPQEWSNAFKSEGLRKYLSFTQKDIDKIRQKLGIYNHPLVGVHVRDTNYDSKNINDVARLEGWQHRVEPLYRYRERAKLRNSNLLNFIPTFKELSASNNFFVRFGNHSELFPPDMIKPLIDYGNSELRSPKNDLLLMCTIDYLICSASGLAHLAHWLRIPIFLIDYSDFFHPPARGITINSAPIILPKEVRYKKDNKLLSLNEIKNSKVLNDRAPRRWDYLLSPECEIYLTENEPETIRNTIILGHNFLLNKKITSEIELGKKSYQSLYEFDSYNLAPILSPYWKNIDST